MNSSPRFHFILISMLLLSGAAYAATVNVSTQWCGGGCSEGHNDTECICTFDYRYNPSTPGAWVSCREVKCCDTNWVYCDLGYVFEGSSGYCDYEVPESQGCGVARPDGGGWAYCNVACGGSGCWAPYAAQHMEVVNDGNPYHCTRSNETADWWNPWTWTTPCTLWDQSPWDDHGSGLICG